MRRRSSMLRPTRFPRSSSGVAPAPAARGPIAFRIQAERRLPPTAGAGPNLPARGQAAPRPSAPAGQGALVVPEQVSLLESFGSDGHGSSSSLRGTHYLPPPGAAESGASSPLLVGDAVLPIHGPVDARGRGDETGWHDGHMAFPFRPGGRVPLRGGHPPTRRGGRGRAPLGAASPPRGRRNDDRRG